MIVFLENMQKTHKGIAKRFKVTGGGKILRRTAGKRHLLRNKSTRQKREYRSDKRCGEGLERVVRKGLPHGN